MRDPNRIDKVLAAIGEVWAQYPDLRLGQLILNMCEDPRSSCPNLYYIEDDKLTEGLKEYYDEFTRQVNIMRKIREESDHNE